MAIKTRPAETRHRKRFDWVRHSIRITQEIKAKDFEIIFQNKTAFNNICKLLEGARNSFMEMGDQIYSYYDKQVWKRLNCNYEDFRKIMCIEM